MDVDGRLYEGRDAIRSIFTSAADSLVDRPGPRLLRHFTALQIDVESETFARRAATTRS